MKYDILAAFMFFTRLPFWKLKVDVPSASFKHVVYYWPLIGWLTGGVMALTCWLLSYVFPLSVAVLFAIAARIVLTGALHEDGLADFFDGFGGGTDKTRILSIMKDSHIGTYGVIGLSFSLFLFYTMIVNLHFSVSETASLLLVGDVWSKFVASHIVNLLPYARKEEESKAKVVYEGMSLKVFGMGLLFALCPMSLFFDWRYFVALIFPFVVFWGLTSLMNKKIQGYTGDCCGATFLLCELSFYIGIYLSLYLF